MAVEPQPPIQNPKSKIQNAFSPLFPYNPRPHQPELVGAILKVAESGGHLVLQSPAGTGKTVSALAALLDSALRNGCKLLYLTRTNSQQTQVVSEFRRIAPRLPRPVLLVAMQGRLSMCPLAAGRPEWRGINGEELSAVCSGLRKATRAVRNGKEPVQSPTCAYYAAFLSSDHDELSGWFLRERPTAEEVGARCTALGICPYEVNKAVLPPAEAVVAPYIYFFEPGLRAKLLSWMGVDAERLLVLVDEAHNLPAYAREIRTVRLTERTVLMARREAENSGDPQAAGDGGIRVSDVLDALRNALLSLVNEYVAGEDGVIPPTALEEELMVRLGVTSVKLASIVNALLVQGEIVREARRKAGRLPRSHLYSVGAFLEEWLAAEGSEYVKLVAGGSGERAQAALDDFDGDAAPGRVQLLPEEVRVEVGKGNPRLEAYCLDPSLAAAPLRDCRAGVHMSGTLVPLEEYRDTLGLPETSATLRLPSPFAPENLLLLYNPDLTTRYDDLSVHPELLDRIGDEIVRVINGVRRNAMVFFPSHDLRERLIERGLGERIERPLYIESQEATQAELTEIIARFRSAGAGEAAVLLAVVGGRVSEGLDFPGAQLELALIVGIPYPQPTARQRALQHFCEVKFGRGWEYTVKTPAARRLLQAVGRLIRSETDRGAAYILDKRAVHFAEYLPGLRAAKDAVAEMGAFFGK